MSSWDSGEYGSLPNPEATDPLTGLPDRVWLMAQLHGYDLVPSHPYALVMADLDLLKVTNDTMGHAAGDQLLRDTAQTLQESMRQRDESGRPSDTLTATRISGDEFVLLLPGVNNQVQVDAIVERTQNNLAKRGISASCGGRPRKWGEKGEDLLAEVDKLMYQQKVLRRQERIAALPVHRRIAHKLGVKLVQMSGVEPPR